MPNHFHFLIEEIKEGGISNFMQKSGTSYGKYFSIKYGRSDSLFQGRFKAVHIKSNDQLKYLLAYINIINPAQLIEPNLKEKGIENFEHVWEAFYKYSWSTHFEFMGKRKSILIDKRLLGKIFPSKNIYIDFMKEILNGKVRNIWEPLENLTID